MTLIGIQHKLAYTYVILTFFFTYVSTDAPYAGLSHTLASLVHLSDASNDTLKTRSQLEFYSGTRLQLMNGSIPYLPCPIRLYESREITQCTYARTSRGLATWIALYGDSTLRQKLEVLLDLLPHGFTYSYFLNGTQVSSEEFKAIVSYVLEYRPLMFEVFGHRPKNPSTLKNKTHPSESFRNDDNYHEGNNGSRGYDDQGEDNSHRGNNDHNGNNGHYNNTISGNGNFREHNRNRYSLNEGHDNWKDNMVNVMDIVAAKYTRNGQIYGAQADGDTSDPSYELRVTLIWATCGSRSGKAAERDAPKVTKLQEWAKEDIIPDIIILSIKRWMLRLIIFFYPLRSTGAWQWDSTLPFNLANIHECKMIKDTSYFGNPIYSSHWTMCTDIHHASFETNANELQMIFNYLCNPYLTASQQYCCSEQ
nr:uncharacterized protein LOC128695696 [Cherax quadricarinatus]